MVLPVRIALRLAALLAILLFTGVTGLRADEARVFPNISIATPGTSGAAAITALGSALPAVAAFYGKTPEQLRSALLLDSGLRVSRTGRLYHVWKRTGAAVSARLSATAQSMPWAASSAAPLDQTFRLHSNPGAAKTIYLNFAGATLTTANSKAAFELNRPQIVVPAYSTDASATYSAEELRIIQEIWQRVSEDYAPFDVDVTTEPVAADRITRATTSDPNFGIDVLFAAEAAEWDCLGCNGYTFFKAFFERADDSFKPAVVFYSAGNVFDAQALADSASREIGTSLGLSVDGKSGEDSFYNGQGNSLVNGWAPIMAGLSSRPLRQFDKGEYANARSIDDSYLSHAPEDDFEVIIANGLPLRADDAGNTIAAAAWLPVTSSGGRSTASFDGVIASDTDTDVFSLRAGAGLLDVKVDPATVGANADLVLTLLDANGSVIESSNPLQNLSASISRQIVVPGRYYLAVKGTGEGDPLVTGYSSYGSVGAYSLTGSFATPSNALPNAIFSATPATGRAPLAVTLDASASGDDGQIMRYRWDFGDGTARTDATSAPVQKTFAAVRDYTVTLQVTDDTGLTASASRTITATGAAADNPPVASFTASPLTGVAPLTVTLDPAGSSDDGTITGWHWDFGNGTSQDAASGATVSQTFTTPGTYPVRLRVTDNGDLTGETTRTITVTSAPQPPVASFTVTPLTSMAPLEVTLDASASHDDGSIRSYHWDFGDGTSEEGVTPGPTMKVFYAPKSYTITLRVTDDAGLTNATTRSVTVTPAVPPVAAFTASRLSGVAPLDVTFDPAGSHDDAGITTYRWIFGEGTSVDQYAPDTASITYNTPGTYTVKLRVIDTAKLMTEATRVITVTGPQPPVASFTASAMTGVAPLQVTFDASGSTDDGAITAYHWDFGDGTSQDRTSAGPVSKTYSTPGSYSVRLRVTDNASLTHESSRTITVTAPAQPPVAAFSASPMTGMAPLAVTFDASASTDDEAITAYRWDFGDGTSQDSSSAGPVSKTYSTPGSYTARLRVTDNAGLTHETSRTITVTAAEQAPVASFSASSTTGMAPLDVTFDASSSTDDGTITAYYWDFGDGTSAEAGAVVSKTFASPGSYPVLLRVTDNAGLTAEASREIIVSMPQQPPVPSFSASPLSGPAPLQVTFDASATRAEGMVSSWHWDFGDGTTQDETAPEQVSKTYVEPGTYTVKLRVTDEAGLSGETTRDVVVTAAPQAPVAAFTASPLSGTAPLRVTFDASGSTDDGAISAYHWEFGDGATQDDTRPGPVTKVFAEAGSYVVKLRVTDQTGLTGEASRTISVTDIAPPEAGIPRVSDVSMLFARAARGRVKGRAAVTVVDAEGNPLRGATVVAQWSGNVSSGSTGRTNRTGKVNLTSPSTSASGCVRLTVVSFKVGAKTYAVDSSASAEACR